MVKRFSSWCDETLGQVVEVVKPSEKEIYQGADDDGRTPDNEDEEGEEVKGVSEIEGHGRGSKGRGLDAPGLS